MQNKKVKNILWGKFATIRSIDKKHIYLSQIDKWDVLVTNKDWSLDKFLFHNSMEWYYTTKAMYLDNKYL